MEAKALFYVEIPMRAGTLAKKADSIYLDFGLSLITLSTAQDKLPTASASGWLHDNKTIATAPGSITLHTKP